MARISALCVTYRAIADRFVKSLYRVLLCRSSWLEAQRPCSVGAPRQPADRPRHPKRFAEQCTATSDPCASAEPLPAADSALARLFRTPFIRIVAAQPCAPSASPAHARLIGQVPSHTIRCFARLRFHTANLTDAENAYNKSLAMSGPCRPTSAPGLRRTSAPGLRRTSAPGPGRERTGPLAPLMATGCTHSSGE